ncbi:hypothetical protein A2625_04190 [candidate division WOR-1 bacterium RIFCSPHIGHO2_01_FULL_53_15]|uniref:Uncharacterized protein TP-0789 domain-containing protein n=1 Tax=candidate division WOR-1 bacterium RIFCSPHIGHO2_01_FULL_53_15 TaxID=1802564 RepID=A0A1F4Q291_UNCSA|nr:MAG: hypothetical protein A2625_04190 [candidate division WOR-1 bacterium RIFCSPHIGHO2_01_FULL_53_15]OGC13710.1 MAG: hypothetical protein A3D23_03230 [candidate division WOR-1 bacterium RIFCSPHIGHO2_02_FULL_53_26]
MKKAFLFLCFFAAICLSASLAAPLSLNEVIKNLQSNQSKIKDMYAETKTTITSNMVMPGQETKGPQKMVQKGKMWTKGESKSKIEMLSPMKQTTVTNGDKMAIINPETGQKMVQDLKRLKGQGTGGKGQESMSLEKAKEFFDLSVAEKDGGYVITGVPKKDNKFLGKMQFFVDPTKWVPVKIVMYDAKGKPMSQSEIEYKKVSDIWVPEKNKSLVTTPMGKMEVEMEFSNIKVNKGISDGEFKVE